MKECLSFVSDDFEADLSTCYKLKGEMTIPKSVSGRGGERRGVSNGEAGGGNAMEEGGIHIDSGDIAGDSGSGGSGEEEEDIEYLRKFFVMPDFHTILKGFVKQEGDVFTEKEQVLLLLLLLQIYT